MQKKLMEEKENITHPVNVFVLPLSNEITIMLKKKGKKREKAVKKITFIYRGREVKTKALIVRKLLHNRAY